VSYVFIIVFTVLNILIGVVLHSMDQARDEANESSSDSTELRNYSNSIEAALADGKISQEEANRLLEQLEAVRSALKESGTLRELR
jgi:voltage-gated sodium channel